MGKVVYVNPDEAAAWEEHAACKDRDPDQKLFFPDHGNRSPRKAKAICAGCPVQADCLDRALENDERFGIWGGLTEKERRALKRRKNPA